MARELRPRTRENQSVQGQTGGSVQSVDSIVLQVPCPLNGRPMALVSSFHPPQVGSRRSSRCSPGWGIAKIYPTAVYVCPQAVLAVDRRWRRHLWLRRTCPMEARTNHAARLRTYCERPGHAAPGRRFHESERGPRGRVAVADVYRSIPTVEVQAIERQVLNDPLCDVLHVLVAN